MIIERPCSYTCISKSVLVIATIDVIAIAIAVFIFIFVQLLKLIQLIELAKPTIQLLDRVTLGLQLALERLLARIDFDGGALALEAE